jgi:hypothetical protein
MKRLRLRQLVIILCLTMLLSGCMLPFLPEMPDLEGMPDIPGLPQELADVPGMLQDLGLEIDLTSLEDVPGLDALPFLRTEPGALVLRGPIERRIRVGERIPGTDIVLRSMNEDGAVFEIDGMQSVRTYADSLDFDGGWPDIDGVTYNVRLRLYQLGRDSVRAAGVHQLQIRNAAPTPLAEGASLRTDGVELRFPVTWGVNRGETIPGTTLTYVGAHERGGEIGGLGEGVYPYHKGGDSIRWRGQLRADIQADFQLRMLTYGEESARVGGVVRVILPGD